MTPIAVAIAIPVMLAPLVLAPFMAAPVAVPAVPVMPALAPGIDRTADIAVGRHRIDRYRTRDREPDVQRGLRVGRREQCRRDQRGRGDRGDGGDGKYRAL